MAVPNYFAGTAVAARYARARPYLHPHVVDRFRSIVGDVDLALDVACGTGMSSVALLDVARRIVGLDVSRDMLAEATPHARIHYVAADAGAIPLASGSVPLVTVGLAYHWLDHTRFLREASRVLRANGWLVVYNTRFTGRLADVPSFADWWAEQYLVRYPPLPQRSHAITADEASAYGFDLVDHTTFDVPVPLSKAELIAYLSTQSNLLAVAAQRSLPHELEWIETSVREYIDETGGTFRFGGELWVFRRPSL